MIFYGLSVSFAPNTGMTMLLTWDVTSASDVKNYYGSSVSPGADSSRHDGV
jgi:hypothetical protein